MARLIGLDIGTSSAKAIALDETGRILGSATRDYPLHLPEPGWAEQDPEDWWAAAQGCLEELGADRSDAIGLTGQMHGSVFLDSEGRSIRPALVWCDQRTVAECAEIESKVGSARIREITGNPPLSGFQLPKILWLKNHEPEAFSRVRQVLLPKDFIRLRLTGVSATEPSDAGGTGALELASKTWSEEVLQAVGIPAGFFPEVHPSDFASGRWNGIPVAGGGGDQAAAAVGTGAVVPGVVSISLGTSGVVFEAASGCPADHVDSIHDFPHTMGGWHRMGVMLSCGGSIRWVRDLLYSADGYDAMNREAESAGWGADGAVFLPHLQGERCPFVDPHARGGWSGVSLSHSRGTLARAAFEGVCLNLRAACELMGGGLPDRVRANGGGVKSRLWVRLLAEALECPVQLLESDEGPALGAAILGGLSAGVWNGMSEAVSAAVRVRAEVVPAERPPV
ncbi:MAG: xylulokinase, partial [Fimbriimonadaceae bacterium]|nr:xylulokinase [Fimbriimonadaceae bacterium]